MSGPNRLYDHIVTVADLDDISSHSSQFSRHAVSNYLRRVEGSGLDDTERRALTEAVLEGDDIHIGHRVAHAHRYAQDRDDAAHILTRGGADAVPTQAAAITYLNNRRTWEATRPDIWAAIAAGAGTEADIAYLLTLMENPQTLEAVPVTFRPGDDVVGAVVTVLDEHRCSGLAATELSRSLWYTEKLIASGVDDTAAAEVLAGLAKHPSPTEEPLESTYAFLTGEYPNHVERATYIRTVNTLWHTAPYDTWRHHDAIIGAGVATYGDGITKWLTPAALNWGGPSKTGGELIAEASGAAPPSLDDVAETLADGLAIEIFVAVAAANPSVGIRDLVKQIHARSYTDKLLKPFARQGFRTRTGVDAAEVVEALELLHDGNESSVHNLEPWSRASTDPSAVIAGWVNTGGIGWDRRLSLVDQLGLLNSDVVGGLRARYFLEARNSPPNNAVGRWLIDNIGIANLDLAAALAGAHTLQELADVTAAIGDIEH